MYICLYCAFLIKKNMYLTRVACVVVATLRLNKEDLWMFWVSLGILNVSLVVLATTQFLLKTMYSKNKLLPLELILLIDGKHLSS